jgi:hypothetical protein
MAHLKSDQARLKSSGIVKTVLFGFVSTLLLGAAQPADEKPMLWEATSEIVSIESFDSASAKLWPHKVGVKETHNLCVNPFRPKLGKLQRDGFDCSYTRVSSRNGRVSRKIICQGDPSGSFVTVVRGQESADAYDLMQTTIVRNDLGKKLWVSKLHETGRRIGECPIGMA